MTRVSGVSRLERLDVAFGRMRRIWESPALRREVQRRLGQSVEPGTIRTLRAVAVTTAADGECGVGDVAVHLGVDISTASRMIDAAVEMSWLTRGRAPGDRRRSVLSVTDTGAQVLARALAVRGEILEELTVDLGDAEVEQLAHLLERVAERLLAYEDGVSGEQAG